ncbi:MAG: GntR family transcriptional regulator [Chloroflexi bacterium]|nr:GntR family transcriptional regulator [Chloroflexota bacterium]
MTNHVYGIKKVPSHSLRRQAYQQIKDLIVHNKLRPNQEIVIDQLARELGMSHTPVREALIKLELDGLVTMERHRTPRVSEIRMEDIREMYQVRMLLEGWAAAQAAGNLSDAQLSELSDLLERALAEAREHRYEIHLTADLDFHDTLISAAPNELFKRLAIAVTDQTLRLRSLVQTVATQHIEQIVAEHGAILNALRARNPELARQCMVAHLDAAMGRTLETCEREASGILQPQKK